MTGVEPGAVIDVHMHFLPSAYRIALARQGLETLDRGMPIPAWSVDLALGAMDRNGVGCAILSVSSPGLNPFEASDEASLAREINESGARIISDHPTRFGGFASLPVGDIAASLREIDYALDELKLDGFILETNHRGTYPSDPAFRPILEALNARRAIVLLHPTTPACPHCASNTRPAPLIDFPFETTRAVVEMIYSGTLARYSDIRFILAHAGGTLPFLAQRIAGFSMMPVAGVAPGIDADAVIAQLRRLYYDTALSATPAQIGALRQLVPVEQIVFGSDWPFSPEPVLKGSLATLEMSELFDAQDRALVLGGNAARLLARVQAAV